MRPPGRLRRRVCGSGPRRSLSRCRKIGAAGFATSVESSAPRPDPAGEAGSSAALDIGIRPRLAGALPCRAALSGLFGPDAEEDPLTMPRTRQQNVTAAQWSANGGALGAPTSPSRPTRSSAPTSSRIDGPAPAPAQARLQARCRRRSPRGEALDADARRRRRAGDEGLGAGARRHALHALVPAADRPRPPRSTTPSTARPATAPRSPSSPARSSSRASPTPRRSRPAASARRSRRAATPRGTRPRRRSSSRTPTARCCASRRRSCRGRARRWTTRSRCCARWTRCRKSAHPRADAARRRRRRSASSRRSAPSRSTS